MLDRCLEEEHATMLKDLSPMVTGLLKMPNMIQSHLRYFSPATTGMDIQYIRSCFTCC